MMKFFLLLSLALPFFCASQELKENKIDEFTKHAVKRTSYENIIQSSAMTLFFRASKIDKTTFLDIKIMIRGKIFAIQDEQKLMLKLSNDTIVNLSNLEYAIACEGCGANGFVGSKAYGVNTSYIIDEENLKLLADIPISKIRVYTKDGYVEDDVKERKADILQKELLLLQ